jgi:hypothetical protein
LLGGSHQFDGEDSDWVRNGAFLKLYFFDVFEDGTRPFSSRITLMAGGSVSQRISDAWDLRKVVSVEVLYQWHWYLLFDLSNPTPSELLRLYQQSLAHGSWNDLNEQLR